MTLVLSLRAREELIKNIRSKYQQADWKEKGKILDGFIAASGYNRKYAIILLNTPPNEKSTPEFRGRKPKYNQPVLQALIMLWNVANQICSKRLIPFLPELVSVLERHGHLSLPDNVRKKLLTISAATADRLLKKEKIQIGKGICTTKPGSLLKKQIQVRTFSDWNDVTPGFIEADLVAHCGEFIGGNFLNTLVITDIVSGWTECFPLLHKSSSSVISSLKIAQEILPFKLLGIDTDNGSEFINYDLVEFCKDNDITFTRSRAYRKNDQAHVEEKNGSIVRKLIGYDRFEGIDAWQALSDLYSVTRCYVNFFQPSLKLISKTRVGSNVSKKYDKAKTPYQRLIDSDKIIDADKTKLRMEYKKLDPVDLLQRLAKYQEIFLKHAWSKQKQKNDIIIESKLTLENLSKEDNYCKKEEKKSQSTNVLIPSNYKYHKTKKPRKKIEVRTWRTRKDPFEDVWDKLQLKLQLNPELTAKSLLDEIILESPKKHNISQLRTLQRRVASLRKQQLENMKKQYLIQTTEKKLTNEYLSLIMSTE